MSVLRGWGAKKARQRQMGGPSVEREQSGARRPGRREQARRDGERSHAHGKDAAAAQSRGGASRGATSVARAGVGGEREATAARNRRRQPLTHGARKRVRENARQGRVGGARAARARSQEQAGGAHYDAQTRPREGGWGRGGARSRGGTSARQSGGARRWRRGSQVYAAQRWKGGAAAADASSTARIPRGARAACLTLQGNELEVVVRKLLNV